MSCASQHSREAADRSTLELDVRPSRALGMCEGDKAGKGVSGETLDLKLSGKVAMVGGASRGLGFAVARALAAAGARVSIASRNRQAIEAAGRRIELETAVPVLASAADLASADAIARWHQETLDRFGGIDLLFTNAGGPPAGGVLDFDDAAWQAAFELLVLGVVRQIRLVVPSMQARGGGAIVMSTSSAVKEPIANIALSNVLRASVAALAKTLALELAGSQIRVRWRARSTRATSVSKNIAGFSPA